MALQGTLRDFSLADILQLIGLQRKTGILLLKGAEDTVSVMFEEGRIVGAESKVRHLEDRLGHVLLKTGKVPRAELNRMLRKQKETGQRIGDLLVQGTALSDEDLGRALALQVTQIVYRLFRWSEAEFRFTQTSTMDYERERFRPIQVESMLMEGLRILDEWPLIERRVNSMALIYLATDVEQQVRAAHSGDRQVTEADLDAAFSSGDTDAPPVEKPERPESLSSEVVSVSRNEFTVYELLDGKLTVQDVIDRSDLGEFETCKALFELLEKGLIEEFTPTRSEPRVTKSSQAAWDRALTALTALVGTGILLAGLWQNLPVRVDRALAPYTAADSAAETLRLSASQSRMARLEFSVRLFALYRSTYPQSLEELEEMGLVNARDLRDPWGRTYDYILTRRSYQIRGADGDGEQRPELLLTGRLEPHAQTAPNVSELLQP